MIRGAVFSADGTPASDAAVKVWDWRSRWRPELAEEPKCFSAAVDPVGAFTVTGLEYGDYWVIARKAESMALGRARISPGKPVDEVTLVLEDCRPLGGATVDGAGNPVAGAILTPVENDETSLTPEMGQALQTQSGADGRFLFEGLKPVAWRLRVEAQGFALLITDPLKVGQLEAKVVLTRGGSVSGVCLNASDGSPYPGVSVLARREVCRDPDKATSDDAGRFAFEMLAPDTYLLLPQDDGLTTVEGPVRVQVTEGAATTGVVLKLGPAGIVRGRVYDAATKAGIADAEVWAGLEVAESEHFPSRVSERTGPSGDYEVCGLGPAAYHLSCNLPRGFVGQLGTSRGRLISVSPSHVMANVDFAVSRGMFLSGVVVDTKGQPVAYAHVKPYGCWASETYSNSAGEFAMEVHPNQQVRLIAQTRELASKIHGPYLPGPEGLEGVRVVMDLALDCLIAGHVVNTLNQPVRALVGCSPTDSEMQPYIPSVSTDLQGRFVIPELAAGDYELRLGREINHCLDTPIPAAAVHLNPGQKLAGVRLVLDESGVLTLSGHVLGDDGAPVAHAMVCATGPDRVTIQISSDEQGYYECYGLSEGAYYIQARGVPPYGDSRPVSAEAGSEGVDLVLPRLPTVAGQVVDARTGAPISAFEIASVHSETPAPEELRGGFLQASDAEGRFVLDGVRGQCVVLVRARGYSPGALNLGFVQLGQTFDNLRIALQPGRPSLEGFVQDADGHAVANALIFLGPVRGPYDSYKAAATTDQNGAFQLDPSIVPDSNEVVLSAFAPGYCPALVSVASGAGPVGIVLAPEGVVSGTVRRDGQPADACVYTTTPSGDSPSAYTDSNGNYRIGALPAGTFKVHANLLQGHRAAGLGIQKEVEVRQGSETTVDFDFEGTSAVQLEEPVDDGQEPEEPE